MRSPWKLGLLAAAVVGVVIYNIYFFTGYQSKKPIAVYQATANQNINSSNTDSMVMPEAEIVSEPPDSDSSAAAPQIHSGNIQNNALKPFLDRSIAAASAGREWPERDPFSFSARPTIAAVHKISRKTFSDTLVQEPVPEPNIVFSGTLINQQRKLALIDGFALSVGAHIGKWLLTEIENDHVTLQVGSKTRRIEMKKEDNRHPKEPL